MESVSEKKKTHNPRKKKFKDQKKAASQRKNHNPKAFTFSGGVKSVEQKVRRTLDIQSKRCKLVPLVKTSEISSPQIVVIQGPPNVGKSTLVKSLIKHYTKINVMDKKIEGAITFVSNRHQRLTVFECSNDVRHFLDFAKIADLAIIMINAKSGFEMDTFEFINILQTHSFPRVIGVLTHLDELKETKVIRKIKKQMKNRFWKELYEGAKLFYLSGLQYGRYNQVEIKNLARYISIQKYPSINWRETHPYILALKFEAVEAEDEEKRKDFVNGLFYGYIKGCKFHSNQMVHIAGLGDYPIGSIKKHPDPCCLPDSSLVEAGKNKDYRRMRTLKDKDKRIYSAYSDCNFGSLQFDSSTNDIYITIPDYKNGGFTLERQDNDSVSNEVDGDNYVSPNHHNDDEQVNDVTDGYSENTDSMSEDQIDEEDEAEEEKNNAYDATNTQQNNGNLSEAVIMVRNLHNIKSETLNQMKIKRNRLKLIDRSEKSITMDIESPGKLNRLKSDFLAGIDDKDNNDVIGNFLDEESAADDETSLNSNLSDDEVGVQANNRDIVMTNPKTEFLSTGNNNYHSSEQAEMLHGNSKGALANIIYDKVFFTICANDPLSIKSSEDTEKCFSSILKLNKVVYDLLSRFVFINKNTLERMFLDLYLASRKNMDFDQKDYVISKSTKKIPLFDSSSSDESHESTRLKKKNNFFQFKVSLPLVDVDTFKLQEEFLLESAFGIRNFSNEFLNEEEIEEFKRTRFSKGWENSIEKCVDQDPSKCDVNGTIDETIKTKLDEAANCGEGFHLGSFVEIYIENIPKSWSSFYSPKNPIIIGGILPQEENSNFCYMQIRVKKHRWAPRILKSNDALFFSIGWRRFQSIPVYSLEDRNQTRMRMIKYTPEHMHCIATVYGPIAPPNTGVVAIKTLEKIKDYRISLTGVLLKVVQSPKIVKKLKLIGEPQKIYKNTAFIKGMFNSDLEVSKFIGASIRTVSGIRGAIKKSLGVNGIFRATFEDKIKMSDIIFAKTWIDVEVKKIYNPLIDVSPNNWRRILTHNEIRRTYQIPYTNVKDRNYGKKEERTPKIFNKLRIPAALCKKLSFSSKPKILKNKDTDKNSLIYGDEINVIKSAKEKESLSLIKKLLLLRKNRLEKRKMKAQINLLKKKKGLEMFQKKRVDINKERKKKRSIKKSLKEEKMRKKMKLD